MFGFTMHTILAKHIVVLAEKAVMLQIVSCPDGIALEGLPRNELPFCPQIMPQGAVDGQPCPSWLQCPGRMTGLPSGAVLMVSEGHGARIVAGAAEGGPRVAQVINLVSQLASAFTTDRSRLCQKQVR